MERSLLHSHRSATPFSRATPGGDGLYLVLANAADAARCALAMQSAMDELDLAELGFSPDLQLRLGAHFGPVRRLLDPVTGRASFFGEHVSRAARIEPITKPGAVYVTERFAAELLLTGCPGIACTYIGEMVLAKNYMTSRMYVLRPAP